MGGLTIPDGARGRVGMVAVLHRVRPELAGRMVAVRHPVGRISALTDSERPIFAWQVLVLGEPVAVNGRPSREIIVADRCLQPVGQVAPGQVEQFAVARAQEEVDRLAAEVRRMLAARPMTGDELDQAVERAGEAFLIRHALEEVPIAVALNEVGFVPKRPGDEETPWRWSGTHEGVELFVTACQDMFGMWNLVGTCIQPREMMFDEQVLPERAPRGQVALQLATMWQTAFGRDVTVPGRFEIGRLYQRHLAEMRSLEVGLPTLRVDGQVLRATRRWLSERFGIAEGQLGPLPDVRLSLAFREGMLRFEAGESVYAVPAQGVWVGDCEVSLREFLAIPYWRLRGDPVALERSCEAVAFNGEPVSITDRSAGAQA